MDTAKSLNSKQVTRCTLRFYDPILIRELETLWKKIGGTQNDFFTMLIKEGYKVVKPRYEHITLPDVEPVKCAQEAESESSIQEVKDLIISNTKTLANAIKSLSKEHKIEKGILSCIHNVLVEELIEDDGSFLEYVNSGGFDRLPKRFREGDE